MRIVYSRAVKLYLRLLVKNLYDNEYFAFEETALKYVVSLITDMKSTIHLKKRKKASDHFLRYGKDLYYVSYPKNKRTTWYFFFTYHPDSDTYYIRYIANNYVAGHLLE